MLEAGLQKPMSCGVGNIRTYEIMNVSFELFMAMTMKNAIFCDVTRCGSCKNRRFRGTYQLHQAEKYERTRNNVSSNQLTLFLARLFLSP
jgi:hypothetical protein